MKRVKAPPCGAAEQNLPEINLTQIAAVKSSLAFVRDGKM